MYNFTTIAPDEPKGWYSPKLLLWVGLRFISEHIFVQKLIIFVSVFASIAVTLFKSTLVALYLSGFADMYQ